MPLSHFPKSIQSHYNTHTTYYPYTTNIMINVMLHLLLLSTCCPQARFITQYNLCNAMGVLGTVVRACSVCRSHCSVWVDQLGQQAVFGTVWVGFTILISGRVCY